MIPLLVNVLTGVAHRRVRTGPGPMKDDASACGRMKAGALWSVRERSRARDMRHLRDLAHRRRWTLCPRCFPVTARG